MYDVNQQKSDDLRVLKSTAVLTPIKNNDYTGAALFSTTYEVDLPDDYLHILNCVAEYSVLKSYKCYDAGNKAQFGAKRLTADMFSQIINNYYMRPSYKSPYFYINNVSTDHTYPIGENVASITNDTSVIKNYIVVMTPEPASSDFIDITINGVSYVIQYDSVDPGEDTGFFNNIQTLLVAIKATGVDAHLLNPTTIIVPNPIAQNITLFEDSSAAANGHVYYITPIMGSYNDSSLVEKSSALRYGNRSKVRMELRYGKDDSVFQLSKIYIDYLKAPAFIRLTQEQVDNVTDNSQLLEFPDYVCQEITNELIRLLMENASDPRLQTNIPINQSIANPAQEQPQQKR